MQELESGSRSMVWSGFLEGVMSVKVGLRDSLFIALSAFIIGAATAHAETHSDQSTSESIPDRRDPSNDNSDQPFAAPFVNGVRAALGTYISDPCVNPEVDTESLCPLFEEDSEFEPDPDELSLLDPPASPPPASQPVPKVRVTIKIINGVTVVVTVDANGVVRYTRSDQPDAVQPTITPKPPLTEAEREFLRNLDPPLSIDLSDSPLWCLSQASCMEEVEEVLRQELYRRMRAARRRDNREFR